MIIPIAKKIASLSGKGRGAFALALMMLAINLPGQGWEIEAGGNKEDYGRAVLQTIDHGYIAVGFSESFGDDNDNDVYVVRTDVDGVIIFEKTYDEGIEEQAYDIIELEDGGFWIVGFIQQVVTAKPDVYLLRIDKKGNRIGSFSYPYPADERGVKIIPTPDGGYAILGVIVNPGTGKSDISVIKIDSQADFQWRTVMGEADASEAGAGIARTETGFLIAATLREGVNTDILLYQVDHDGTLIDTHAIGRPETGENAESLIGLSDGNFAIAGTLKENGSSALLLKVTANCDTIWTRTVSLPESLEDEGYRVIENADGSLVLFGFTSPTGDNLDILAVKFSPDGDVLWTNTIGSPAKSELIEDIAATRDGGFIITGASSNSLINFITDLNLVKVDGFANLYTNHLTGNVFHDQQGCSGTGTDISSLAGWLIKAEKTNGSLVFYGTTNENGDYDILVDTGSYQVTLLPINEDYWNICEPTFTTAFTTFYDTTETDFAVSTEAACPALQVSNAVASLVNCEDAQYTVSYCNLGPVAAPDAYVEIILDEDLTYLSSSITPSTQADSLYTFPVGDVASMECGSFTINVAVACEGVQLGQAALMSAHIYPDSICVAPGDWNGASIKVNGYCEGDSILFNIQNIGPASMLESKTYFIVEDQIMFRMNPFILEPDQIKEEKVPANGSTWRLIAEQVDNHPGNSYPTIAVEGCVEEGEPFSVGNYTQFPEDDQDLFKSVDVQEIMGSGLPTFMRGYPKGYRDSIVAQNTDITYTLFFENTGTDTIDRVVIRDTLSPYLDITSVIPGSSSHPYEFEIYDNGILKFTFDQIQLQPGGSTEEALTSGFVKFRIAQKPSNPLGTVISNSAAVYFDYVAPAETNQVSHTVGCVDLLQEGCITVDVNDPKILPGVEIKVFPNPFFESATFEIEGVTITEGQFVLYDLTGRLLRTEIIQGNKFNVYRSNLPAGMYVYMVTTKKQAVASGKLIVR